MLFPKTRLHEHNFLCCVNFTWNFHEIQAKHEKFLNFKYKIISNCWFNTNDLESVWEKLFRVFKALHFETMSRQTSGQNDKYQILISILSSVVFVDQSKNKSFVVWSAWLLKLFMFIAHSKAKKLIKCVFITHKLLIKRYQKSLYGCDRLDGVESTRQFFPLFLVLVYFVPLSLSQVAR